MKGIKILNEKGDIIRRFYTIREAAHYYQVRPATIIYRTNNKKVVDGEVFLYDNELDYMSKYVVAYRKPFLKGIDDSDEPPKGIDWSKCVEVPYDVKYNHLCRTVCPYSLSPKPLVGSGKCLGCTHFRWRDKEKHIVYCVGHRF